jgi:hypothetical protein
MDEGTWLAQQFEKNRDHLGGGLEDAWIAQLSRRRCPGDLATA